MAHHEKARVEQAVAPSAYDIAIASDVILAALAGGIVITSQFFAPVADRLASEPVPAAAREIEGVAEVDVRRVRANAATMSAVAHLEARGAILPIGSHHYYHPQHEADAWSVPSGTERVPRSYRIDGPYNFGIAEAYRLPAFDSRAPIIDSPAVFLTSLPSRMGDKVRRVLSEAVDAYRAGLRLGTAVLLGVASEAAWAQIARSVLERTDDAKLRSLSEAQYPSAGAVQQRVLEIVRSLGLKGIELPAIAATEQAYRDLRNYAAHRPEEAFEEERVARAIVGTMLEASVDYFRRLYELDEKVRASAGDGTRTRTQGGST